LGHESSKRNIVFKPYDPNQRMLLPPSLDELIAESHPVRIVNEMIGKIDLDILSEQY
jgi:transposase